MSDIKKIKPFLSKGTRDFLPGEVARRNYIFDTIKTVLRKYGFDEIETPAIEKLETLNGKYGDEGDKLLFKILNSGDYLKDIPNDKFLRKESFGQIPNYKEWLGYISEKGLRYDFTVPLARYVVMNQEQLAFPFRRFQIGPVWRADRPQKGRYQEFYQCDADIIGSTSLFNEVELTMIYAEVFKKLGIDVIIRMNSRKFIDEVLRIAGIAENKAKVITLLDKSDKVEWGGEKGIKIQLTELGLGETQIVCLHDYLLHNKELRFIKDINNAIIQEIETIRKFFANNTKVCFDPALMRGLDYYTGTIWEVVLDSENSVNKNISIGSLGGGGRYDKLTEMFGGQNMSGVGISFGIERIYDVMKELGLFPATIAEGVRILFVPRNEMAEAFAFSQVQAVREAGIGAELFLGNFKKQKHLQYADDKNIAFLVEVGENEANTGKFRLRNVKKREITGEFELKDLLPEILK